MWSNCIEDDGQSPGSEGFYEVSNSMSGSVTHDVAAPTEATMSVEGISTQDVARGGPHIPTRSSVFAKITDYMTGRRHSTAPEHISGLPEPEAELGDDEVECHTARECAAPAGSNFQSPLAEPLSTQEGGSAVSDQEEVSPFVPDAVGEIKEDDATSDDRRRVEDLTTSTVEPTAEVETPRAAPDRGASGFDAATEGQSPCTSESSDISSVAAAADCINCEHALEPDAAEAGDLAPQDTEPGACEVVAEGIVDAGPPPPVNVESPPAAQPSTHVPTGDEVPPAQASAPIRSSPTSIPTTEPTPTPQTVQSEPAATPPLVKQRSEAAETPVATTACQGRRSSLLLRQFESAGRPLRRSCSDQNLALQSHSGAERNWLTERPSVAPAAPPAANRCQTTEEEIPRARRLTLLPQPSTELWAPATSATRQPEKLLLAAPASELVVVAPGADLEVVAPPANLEIVVPVAAVVAGETPEGGILTNLESQVDSSAPPVEPDVSIDAAPQAQGCDAPVSTESEADLDAHLPLAAEAPAAPPTVGEGDLIELGIDAVFPPEALGRDSPGSTAELHEVAQPDVHETAPPESVHVSAPVDSSTVEPTLESPAASTVDKDEVAEAPAPVADACARFAAEVAPPEAPLAYAEDVTSPTAECLGDLPLAISDELPTPQDLNASWELPVAEPATGSSSATAEELEPATTAVEPGPVTGNSEAELPSESPNVEAVSPPAAFPASEATAPVEGPDAKDLIEADAIAPLPSLDDNGPSGVVDLSAGVVPRSTKNESIAYVTTQSTSVEEPLPVVPLPAAPLPARERCKIAVLREPDAAVPLVKQPEAKTEEHMPSTFLTIPAKPGRGSQTKPDSRLVQLVGELAVWEKRFEDLQTQIAAKEAEGAAVNEKLTRAQSERDAAGNRVKLLETERGALRETLQQEKADRQTVELEMKELQQEQAALRQEQARLGSEVQRLIAEKDLLSKQLEREAGAAKEGARQAAEQLEAARKDLVVVREQRDHAQKVACDAALALKDARNELAAGRGILEELERSLELQKRSARQAELGHAEVLAVRDRVIERLTLAVESRKRNDHIELQQARAEGRRDAERNAQSIIEALKQTVENNRAKYEDRRRRQLAEVEDLRAELKKERALTADLRGTLQY